MQINLLEITIKDFKGIKTIEAKDLKEVNSIVGTNRTGKTSFGNSIIWCLFGKDFQSKTNFEIMPLDENNVVVPHKEPLVELLFDIDGNHKTFKRVLKQKWVKKRGEAKSEFDGSCETHYFIDDVPVKQKDYMSVVNSYCNEDLFRCITLSSYFPSIEWKKRREIITSIVGAVDEVQISKRDEFKVLFEKLNGKSIVDYKKVVSLEKKEYKEELGNIPEGIKASQNFIPETPENWAQLEKDIKEKEEAIISIDNKISDKSEVLKSHKKEVEKRGVKVSELTKSKDEFVVSFTKEKREEKDILSGNKDHFESQINSKNREVSNITTDIDDSNSDIKRNETRISTLVTTRKENEDLYTKHKKTAYEAPKDSTCEKCGQDVSLSSDEIEKLEKGFNQRKADYLKGIIDGNEPLKKECTTLEEKNGFILLSIEEANKQIEKIKKEVKGFETEKSGLVTKIASLNLSKLEIDAKESKEYKAIEAEISELMNSGDAPKVDVEAENQQKADINTELDELKKRLNKREDIEKAEKQIKAYEARGAELAQKIADLEGIEYASELFENAVYDELENKINAKFKGIQFKMFERHNNGGVSPACTILIDGVPFDAANTASQVGAGIEIINMLSEHYNIFAPILIDGRESVIEIPETKSQVFNLVVDKSVKTLKIN